MAPFAFLGPSYDETLHRLYTTIASRNIFQRLSIIPQLLAGESLADSSPLAAMIDRYVDDSLVAQVADAHRRRRRLYVGTVDLDAQRLVVWNMGLIATSGRPEAPGIFRKVLLASASVPVAFPPVLLDVEAEGRLYDEMHVDGGVAARAFHSGGVFNPAIAVRHSAASARLLGEVGDDRRSLSHLCVRARGGGELPLGHDPRGRRDPGRRGVRPGQDEEALRGRIPDGDRGAGVGDPPPGFQFELAP